MRLFLLNVIMVAGICGAPNDPENQPPAMQLPPHVLHPIPLNPLAAPGPVAVAGRRFFPLQPQPQPDVVPQVVH